MKICRMLYTITVRQKLTAPGTRKLEWISYAHFFISLAFPSLYKSVIK
jgi:hypothetical protein